MLNIDLGKKLVSANLSTVISKYWQKSFKAVAVCFMLDKLEWISNGEVSFLISWINALEYNNVPITISLQNPKDIDTNSIEYEKRKYCFDRIMYQWKLQLHISKNISLQNGEFPTQRRANYSFTSFAAIPIRDYKTLTFDQDYDELYNYYLKDFSDNLIVALKKTEINYYDVNYIDYSIVKELYSNVSLHANSKLSDQCYFSVGLNKKFSGTSDYISENRITELSELEFDFFTSNNKYRNLDYVEIDFHDFGLGITESLRGKYLDENEKDLKEFFGEQYDTHIIQDIDTRIIEYSLLLFTSRYEIERKLEIHNFIPRGLFILKDIVEKYEGYFEIASYNGAVGLNFKNGNSKTTYSKIGSKNIFPGTRIKIVLPSIDKTSIKKEEYYPQLSEEKINNNYHNIHFLKEFAKIESILAKSKHQLEEEVYKNKLTSLLFIEILIHFRSIKDNSIVLVDFAGIEPKTVDFFNKFIYFVTHFPISSNNRLILYNLITKRLNATVVYNPNENLKSMGFTPYPIPCIYCDTSIEWLGVNSISHSEAFTQLWIGNTTHEYTFENLKAYSNSLIKITKQNDRYKISINLPLFLDILEIIDKVIQATIEEELSNEGIQFITLTDEKDKNYNKIIYSKPKTCYLTSSRKYTLEYISFNEKLYIYSYRRMIATYFILKIHKYFPNTKTLKKIDKILSVTLSSQLIGNEVKEILNLLFNTNIGLVALSNYYNFQNEEKFNEIKPKDRVLIVNDILLTGSLTNTIINSIELKEAVPVSCLAILDLRIASTIKIDVPVLALAKSILNLLDAPPDGFDIQVINPVLNLPASIPRSKSKENVLLSKEEFLKLIDEKYLVIGNLKNSAVFFNYFVQTEMLLKDDANLKFPFLRYILECLKERKRNNIQLELSYLAKGFEVVSKNISDKNLGRDIDNVKTRLTSILGKMSPGLFDEYNIDAVFYPFLSHIGVVESNSTPFLEAELNRNSPIIYPIPRVMTTRGWRFSFPPKFLQTIFKQNKLSVLILDDGSLTGETLMQMIDSVSFLSIKSIDVLSIFGRLEDFQKELFSRIKSIHAKESVVPINIYFGVHFDLPIHNINESPFHTEAREITKLEDKLKKMNIEMSEMFESFLIKRKEYLETAEYPILNLNSFNSFSSVSKKELFLIRDFLGRYDSYRLYIEDFPLKEFEYLIKDNNAILSLLTVLNLEPQLYQTFKRIFQDQQISLVISKIHDEFLVTESLMDESWKQEFFIQALFYLDQNEFFKTDNLFKLTERLSTPDSVEKSPFLYLEYLLILVKLKIKTLENSFTTRSFETNVEDFIFKLKSYQPTFNELRFAFTVYSEIQRNVGIDSSLPINKYYKLREYYTQVAIHQSYHDDRLLTNLFKDVNKNISELKHALEHNLLEDIIVNKENLLSAIEKLKENYYKYEQFKFIKDIITDLKRFATMQLPLNITLLDEAVTEFEKCLNQVNIEAIKEIEKAIDAYQNILLKDDSLLAEYIMKSESELVTEWQNVEKTYLSITTYKPINLEHAENFTLNINPYALNLAFDNLILNKIKNAEGVTWKMTTDEHDNYYDLFIEQSSSFIIGKGDGTGQHTIRSILRNYGVIYKRVSSDPYKLKISFSKS